MVLPYAVRDHFTHLGNKVDIIASEVYVEIEGPNKSPVTLRRSIRDEQRSSKLIEIIDGPYITIPSTPITLRPTYLHDSGGALKTEGFHKFLEQYLDYSLPSVPTTSGGETKLYLQSIFAAIAVEQKRGWTDYIANIPFFGIRDARTRVVEFLLALDVFDTNSARGKLNADSMSIGAEWDAHYLNLTKMLKDIGGVINGVPFKVSSLFDPALTTLQKLTSNGAIPLPSYITSLREEYAGLVIKGNTFRDNPLKGQQSELDVTVRELQRLTNIYETASATLVFQSGSVREYELLFNEAADDLSRNKITLKLRDMGAEVFGIEIAQDRCPTCFQYVEDSLLTEQVHGPQMDLATNIQYLEKQSRMLERQIAGGKKVVEETERLLDDLSKRIDNTRSKLNAVRTDVATGAIESRALIRQQIQIEIEIEKLQRVEPEVALLIGKFAELSARLRDNQTSRKKLPAEYYSVEDKRKIRIFETFFRSNASAFEYLSAPIDDIKINDETLVPYLANIELCEIFNPTKEKNKEGRKTGTDIKADSSASDFVRLILSYLLALRQASALEHGGNRHPGLILLDEPGQHSMGQSSQRALLQQLTLDKNFQSIVAASFDESPEVFREVTQGIKFDLVELGEKSIKPVP